jgi:hypothetical protein
VQQSGHEINKRRDARFIGAIADRPYISGKFASRRFSDLQHEICRRSKLMDL